MKTAVFYHHLREAAGEQGMSMPEAYAWAKSLGIDYVELDGSEIADDAAAEKLAAKFREAGLGVSSIYLTYDWQLHSEDMKDFRQIRMAQILGAKHIMPIPGFYSEDPMQQAAVYDDCTASGGNGENDSGAEDSRSEIPGNGKRRTEKRSTIDRPLIHRDQELHNMLQGMQTFVAEAARADVDVTMEDFDNARSPIRNMEGMDAFLRAVPSLSVTLDTGNFRFSAEDAWEAYRHFEREYPGRVRHVHLKDRWIPGGRNSDDGKVVAGDPLTAMDGAVMYPCPVGSGSMPIPQILQALREKGYDGIVSMEFFGAASYTKCIEESARWLRKIW